MHHDLKLLSRYEAPKKDGRKPWELRSTLDRTFSVGDTVTFRIITEAKGRDTGRTVGPVRITWILDSSVSYLLPPSTCIFTHTQPE